MIRIIAVKFPPPPTGNLKVWELSFFGENRAEMASFI